MPRIFSVATEAGVVFATDNRHTIFQLYDDCPVCLGITAKNDVGIKWEEIISRFKQESFEHECTCFMDYVETFISFLVQNTQIDVLDRTELTFSGYGKNDIFPTYVVMIVDSKSSSCYRTRINRHIDQFDNQSAYCVSGDGEELNTLINGISDVLEEKCVDIYRKYAIKYKRSLIEAMEATGIDSYIESAANLDIESNVSGFADSLKGMGIMGNVRKFETAIQSFNMEDLISMAENLVDVSGTENYFRGRSKNHTHTEEISIVTRAEGFVWIKRAQKR